MTEGFEETIRSQGKGNTMNKIFGLFIVLLSLGVFASDYLIRGTSSAYTFLGVFKVSIRGESAKHIYNLMDIKAEVTSNAKGLTESTKIGKDYSCTEALFDSGDEIYECTISPEVNNKGTLTGNI